MRALVLSGFGGLESLVIKELPDPEPRAGQVLIAVKAFGVNHAETHVNRVAKGTYKAKPAAVFSFDEIREAQRLMESNKANGKIVVHL